MTHRVYLRVFKQDFHNLMLIIIIKSTIMSANCSYDICVAKQQNSKDNSRATWSFWFPSQIVLMANTN